MQETSAIYKSPCKSIWYIAASILGVYKHTCTYLSYEHGTPRRRLHRRLAMSVSLL